MTEAVGRPRKPPPRLLMGAMNAAPRLVLRSPLHGLMSKNVLLLSFSGRKSGRLYTTPMSYVQEGGTVFMTTEAPWWKNLSGGAAVAVRLRGRGLGGVGEAVTEEDGVREGLRTILRHYPGYGRFVGVTVDGRGRPDEEAIARAARRGRVLILVKLEGAASDGAGGGRR